MKKVFNLKSILAALLISVFVSTSVGFSLYIPPSKTVKDGTYTQVETGIVVHSPSGITMIIDDLSSSLAEVSLQNADKSSLSMVKGEQYLLKGTNRNLVLSYDSYNKMDFDGAFTFETYDGGACESVSGSNGTFYLCEGDYHYSIKTGVKVTVDNLSSSGLLLHVEGANLSAVGLNLGESKTVVSNLNSKTIQYSYEEYSIVDGATIKVEILADPICGSFTAVDGSYNLCEGDYHLYNTKAAVKAELTALTSLKIALTISGADLSFLDLRMGETGSVISNITNEEIEYKFISYDSVDGAVIGVKLTPVDSGNTVYCADVNGSANTVVNVCEGYSYVHDLSHMEIEVSDIVSDNLLDVNIKNATVSSLRMGKGSVYVLSHPVNGKRIQVEYMGVLSDGRAKISVLNLSDNPTDCFDFSGNDGTMRVCEGTGVFHNPSGIAVNVEDILSETYLKVSFNSDADRNSLTMTKGDSYTIENEDTKASVSIKYLGVSSDGKAEISFVTLSSGVENCSNISGRDGWFYICANTAITHLPSNIKIELGNFTSTYAVVDFVNSDRSGFNATKGTYYNLDHLSNGAEIKFKYDGKDVNGRAKFFIDTIESPTVLIDLPFAEYEDDIITDFSPYNNPFPDTNIGLIEGQASAELFRREVISGYPDGQFKGYKLVNRAEAAKFLLLGKYGEIANISNNGQFPDVYTGEWYVPFVVTAAQKGIIVGYADGFFKPANTINVAEFMKMLNLTFGMEKNLPYTYVDVSMNEWYAQYAGAAQKYELFPHKSIYLSPGDFVSREEVSVAIYQYLKNRD